jgi:hypothetical protein
MKTNVAFFTLGPAEASTLLATKSAVRSQAADRQEPEGVATRQQLPEDGLGLLDQQLRCIL